MDDSEALWRHINPEIPRRMKFFNAGATEAHCMDPQMRLLLEDSYVAILDADINPEALKGSRTGVVIGVLLGVGETVYAENFLLPRDTVSRGEVRGSL